VSVAFTAIGIVFMLLGFCFSFLAGATFTAFRRWHDVLVSIGMLAWGMALIYWGLYTLDAGKLWW